MNKLERLEELRRLQQQGLPESAQAFPEWAHQVRAAIFHGGERRRWDFLSVQYKKCDPASAEARSTRLMMEQLITLEIEDLDEIAKHPGKVPLSMKSKLNLAYLILGILTIVSKLVPLIHHSSATKVTATPTPVSSAASASPKPQ